MLKFLIFSCEANLDGHIALLLDINTVVTTGLIERCGEFLAGGGDSGRLGGRRAGAAARRHLLRMDD